MLFNVNRPASLGQLASMFTSNPNLTPEQVGSNLFTGNSQAYGYIQQQGRNLGIGDPIQYFSKMKLAQQMANTPSGFDMEMARQAGQFSPDSLPGQMQKREMLANTLMAQQAKEAQQIAALQNQQRLQAFPLPSRSGTPEQQVPQLSPVMREDMRMRGITNPMEYLLAQRLGGLASPSIAGGELLRKPIMPLTGITDALLPGMMFNLPSMKQAAKTEPGTAAHIFEALTGSNLQSYGKLKADSAEEQDKAGTASLRRALENREAAIDQTGKLQWRGLVANPTTGKMEPTGSLGEGDLYQKSLEQYLPNVNDKLEELRMLAAARGDVVPLEMGAPVPQDVPDYMQGGSDFLGTLKNTFLGSLEEISKGITFQPSWGEGVSRMTTGGRAPVHARPLLAGNAKFQEIARKDPARARRIIMAIQRGDRHIPDIAPDDSSVYGGGGFTSY